MQVLFGPRQKKNHSVKPNKMSVRIINIIMRKKLSDCNWAEIQETHDSGKNIVEICKTFGISRTLLINAEKMKLFKRIIHKHHMSIDQKNLLSEIRRKWAKDNPEKQREIHLKAMKSKPCQLFKEFLTKHNIVFIEEYNPLVEGRSFHIDIVIPDKMIAIEINGKRHYDKSGNLTPYYQERHDLIASKGWKIYEIYYTCCFSETIMTRYIDDIIHHTNNTTFNITDFLTKHKTQDSPNYKVKTCSCGRLCCRKAKQCRICDAADKAQNIPKKEQLTSLIFKYPATEIASMFGVSDKTIQKWCNRYHIDKPKRGYWMKNKYSKVAL